MKLSLRSTIVIHSSPSRVFETVAVEHLVNHPRWDPHVVRIVPLTTGALAGGSRFDVVRHNLGREEIRAFEVTAWAPPTGFAITTTSSDLCLTLSSRIDDYGSGATQLTLCADASIHGPRALLAPVMRFKFAAELRANLARIKAMIEGEPALVPEPAR